MKFFQNPFRMDFDTINEVCMRALYLLLLSLFLFSCAPASPEEFANESVYIQKELLKLFRTVETQEDLVEKGPKIRSLSYDLVALIKRANEYYKTTNEEIIQRELPVSKALKEEMKRIYEIEGGRSTVEKYQREALFLLDEIAK